MLHDFNGTIFDDSIGTASFNGFDFAHGFQLGLRMEAPWCGNVTPRTSLGLICHGMAISDSLGKGLNGPNAWLTLIPFTGLTTYTLLPNPAATSDEVDVEMKALGGLELSKVCA